MTLCYEEKHMIKPSLAMKYFVLKPGGRSPYAAASRAAMRAYADEIGNADPDLAVELENWVAFEANRAEEDDTLQD